MSYMFNEKFNTDAFFWWQKTLIKHRHWSALSPASKAVFPVIACHANKSGISYPSEDTISALCGLTPKTIRNGINGLADFCGIAWERYLTARGRYSKKIKMELPKMKNKDCFPFFRVVLEYGLWRELYPVMRCFASFDFDEYANENEETDDLIDYSDYMQRLECFFAV